MPQRHKRRSSGKVKKANRPCTYELGYVRQDLYACRKCTEEADGRLSAFCAGCRHTCHSDHIDQVFELYTKRSFRCDCGNKRCRNTCLLQPEKDDINVGNERTYSHNFEGRYCRCDREYDYTKPMAQCAMCEDWFHEECYRTDSRARGGESHPFTTDYEFICRDCVKSLPLLAEYYETLHAWNKPSDIKQWRAARLKKGCVRPKAANPSSKPGTLDLLWKPGFRINLCRCVECSEMYRSASALYLTDRNDFVNVVEEDMSDVFNDKPDEEIVDDVDLLEIGNGNGNGVQIEEDDEDVIEISKVHKRLQSHNNQRQRSIYDGERIPRKPVEMTPAEPSVPPEVSPHLVPEQVESIRQRIFDYLGRSIDKNGGRLNDDEVLTFISDLKAEVLATYTQKLDKHLPLTN